MALVVRLHFTNNSPHNAFLCNSDGQAIYKIETPKKLAHRISTISKIIPNTSKDDMQDRFEEIGQIEWHTFTKTILKTGGMEHEFENSVLTTDTPVSLWVNMSLYSGATKRLASKASTIYGSRWASISLEYGEVWKTRTARMRSMSLLNITHRWILQLEKTDGSKTIIAKFHKRHYGVFAKRRLAYLDIFEGGKGFMDHIIFTFMYLTPRLVLCIFPVAPLIYFLIFRYMENLRRRR